MTSLIKLSLAVLCLAASSINAHSQGCVAVRPMGCSNAAHGGLDLLRKGEFQISGTYRHFKSFRHFRGDVEQHERLEDNTEVINVMHSAEIGLTYALSDRFSLTFGIPYTDYDRSSLYEHYGNSEDANPSHARFHTGASGIGDSRFSANYWLRPIESPSNYSIGLGLKFPTGNPGVEGEFHKIAADGSDSVSVRPVDQSIQLGDGGLGIVLETQGFQRLFEGGYMYFGGFYLFNPRETNDVARNPYASSQTSIISYFSVADQYMARIGFQYIALPQQGVSLGLGGRIEGIPAHDALGGSNGYRRPGYSVMAEPTLAWLRGDFSAEINLPIAMYRNRIKSVSDLSDPTGKAHGDAAFADSMLTIQLMYTFGGKDAETTTSQP